ncbi:MAG TPA: DUF2007 domain-containing protein [Thermoanaerobaculia bacterium]|jgi:hypothetical protein
MFCPECGAEYREGIARCADCDVPLVLEAPGDSEVPKYVTILETSDLSVIPVLKTALEGAGIPYRTRGEGLMDIFPAETLGAPFHSSAGEVEIRVPAERADEARELLDTAATVEGDPDAGTPP